MSTKKFPSSKELAQVRTRLSKGPAAKVLPKNASPGDKVKYSICQTIVTYMNNHKLSQRQLAVKIGTNESLVSKIVYYKIDEFTIDRLLKFLNQLYDDLDVKISVA
jgi:predicted XRE-type DNA-binding protein